MDAHVEQRQPIVGGEKRLPVRNRAHFDRRQHRRAEIAAFKDLFEHAHRLVEAHVLVDGQYFAGGLRFGRERLRVGEIERERLLREDRFDMVLSQRVTDQFRLLIGRKGDVEISTSRILDQRLRRLMDFGNSPPFGDLLSLRGSAGGDRDHREASLLVTGEMDVRHDEASADGADAEFAATDRRIGDKFGRV